MERRAGLAALGNYQKSFAFFGSKGTIALVAWLSRVFSMA